MAEVDPRRKKLEEQRARIRKEAGMPNAYDQSADRHPVREPYPEFGKLYDKFPSGIMANMPGPTKAAAAPASTPTQIPANKGDNTKAAPSPASKPASKPAAKKAKGVAGAASNRDLPGRTTIVMKPSTKNKPALRAASKASLADSKRAAAARRSGGGGGAESVLQSYRGNKSHFKRREK